MGTSINCLERAEDKADGAQKPECTESTSGFRAPTNEVFGSRNKLIGCPYLRKVDYSQVFNYQKSSKIHRSVTIPQEKPSTGKNRGHRIPV